MGKAKNRRSQSAGAVAEPGAATELARRRARKSSERAAGAARKERGHEARGTCLDVRRVLSVHGEKSVKTGRRDEDPSCEMLARVFEEVEPIVWVRIGRCAVSD